MNFVEWLTATTALMPNWVWLALSILAVIIVIVLIAVLHYRSKTKDSAIFRVDEPERDETDEKTEEEVVVPVEVQEEVVNPEAEETVEAEKVDDMAQKKEEKAENANVKDGPAKSEQPAAKSDNRPSAKTYHISLRKGDGKWQVKIGGGEKAIKLFDTQAQAIDFAKSLADNQDANIVIHKKDGSFRKLTY